MLGSFFYFLWVLFSCCFLVRFLVALGCFLGAFLEPKSSQNRPKMVQVGLKTAFETVFFEKREFSRNIGRRNVWSVSRAPRRHPKRPKIAPRRLQDDLQEHLFSTSFLISILVRLGSHFGSILAPKGRPNEARRRDLLA